MLSIDVLEFRLWRVLRLPRGRVKVLICLFIMKSSLTILHMKSTEVALDFMLLEFESTRLPVFDKGDSTPCFWSV